MAISDKLIELNDIKKDIKQAIVDKGVDMTGIDFNGYAGKIGEIETGGGTSGGYTVTFNCYGGMRIGIVRIIQANGSDFVVEVGRSNYVTNIFENVTYIKEFYENASPATYTGITSAEYKAGKTLTNDITLTIYD